MRTLSLVAFVMLACSAFAADEVNVQATLTIDSQTAGFRDQRAINQNYSLTNTQVSADTLSIALTAGTTTKVSGATFPMGWSLWRNNTTGCVVRLCTSLNAGTNLADFAWLQWKSTSIIELSTNAAIVLYAVPVQVNNMSIGTNATLEKRIYSK